MYADVTFRGCKACQVLRTYIYSRVPSRRGRSQEPVLPTLKLCLVHHTLGPSDSVWASDMDADVIEDRRYLVDENTLDSKDRLGYMLCCQWI